jgi:two-component system, OmpR family, response regulator MprA
VKEKEKILIVEDDGILLSMLKDSLTQENYEIKTANNGTSCIKLLRKERFDLLLLDNILPDMTGMETCRYIKSIILAEMPPILFISSVTNTDTRISILDSGADDYICKPFSFKELNARIRALLRRKMNNQSDQEHLDQIILSQITILPKQQKILKGKRHIQLTKTEFSILMLLIRECPNVATRSKIIEEIWNNRMASSQQPIRNTIEVHIANIRRKIESRNRPAMIFTVPGIGYRFENN